MGRWDGRCSTGRWRRIGTPSAVTHVDTGVAAGHHRMEINGLRGRVYIDPGATNPRSGQRTAVYGPYEHERGGEHAFYQQVIDQYGQDIERQMSGLVKVAITR